jgi:aspartate oxidase
MVQNNPLVIHPDGTSEALAYTPPQDEENGQEIQASLTTLQKAVGGYIETVAVQGDDSLILLVNEDGRRLNLPYNPQASELAQRHIVGNAVLLPKALLC